MAKKKNSNAAKSFIMIIITGVALVAITLCWFSIMDKSAVEEFDDGYVKNEASSQAKIYYGADANKKIAIRPEDITQYIKVEDELIVLENMFPGAEYTYIAEFESAQANQKIKLDLVDIRNDIGSNLMESVNLKRRVSLMDGTKETDDESYKSEISETSLDKETSFEYTINKKGKYRVYFSFKIDEETTISKENMSIIIEHVDVVLSD